MSSACARVCVRALRVCACTHGCLLRLAKRARANLLCVTCTQRIVCQWIAAFLLREARYQRLPGFKHLTLQAWADCGAAPLPFPPGCLSEPFISVLAFIDDAVGLPYFVQAETMRLQGRFTSGTRGKQTQDYMMAACGLAESSCSPSRPQDSSNDEHSCSCECVLQSVTVWRLASRSELRVYSIGLYSHLPDCQTARRASS